MKRFGNGQRVLVKAVEEDRIPIPPTLGTVRRLRMADAGAWVALDSRLEDKFHPFPADDETRSTHVLAYPEDCEPAEGK